jgi:hypothetical protein
MTVGALYLGSDEVLLQQAAALAHAQNCGCPSSGSNRPNTHAVQLTVKSNAWKADHKQYAHTYPALLWRTDRGCLHKSAINTLQN